MKKVPLPHLSRKEVLRASARDKRYRFLMADGGLRGVVVNATLLVNQLKANHGLGILETLALGHACLGAVLAGATLKGEDRLRLQIDCEGPMGGALVETTASGEVRGFLKRVPIPVAEPVTSFDLAPFIGRGFLSLTRYLTGSRQPFTGKTALEHGTIAKDLANHFLVSEQIPTAFNLSVQFSSDGWVEGAGGLMLQAMPGVEEDVVSRAEEMVGALPSLGKRFAAAPNPWTLVEEVFTALEPRLLERKRVEFWCRCDQAAIEKMLYLLPEEELEDLARNGPFPVEIQCHHCSTAYHFDQERVRELADRERT